MIRTQFSFGFVLYQSRKNLKSLKSHHYSSQLREPESDSKIYITDNYKTVTPAEAALLASQAASDTKTGEDEEDGGKATEEFMVSVAAINTANAVSNFVALFVILKARSGAAKAAQSILGNGLVPWDQIWAVPWQLGLVLISILVSSIIAYFATIRLGRAFAKHFHKVECTPKPG